MPLKQATSAKDAFQQRQGLKRLAGDSEGGLLGLDVGGQSERFQRRPVPPANLKQQVWLTDPPISNHPAFISYSDLRSWFPPGKRLDLGRTMWC